MADSVASQKLRIELTGDEFSSDIGHGRVAAGCCKFENNFFVVRCVRVLADRSKGIVTSLLAVDWLSVTGDG
jgi:hypothetical protein